MASRISTAFGILPDSPQRAECAVDKPQIVVKSPGIASGSCDDYSGDGDGH
jgi:hypothetical protein